MFRRAIGAARAATSAVATPRISEPPTSTGPTTVEAEVEIVDHHPSDVPTTRQSIQDATVRFRRSLRVDPSSQTNPTPVTDHTSRLVGAAIVPTRAAHPQIVAQFDPDRMMKIITWNVAGLRSIIKKPTHGGKAPIGPEAPAYNKKNPLQVLVDSEQPDVLCLQETKLNPDGEATNHLIAPFDGYSFQDAISREKKGYSGTRTYIKSPTTAATTPVTKGKPSTKKMAGCRTTLGKPSAIKSNLTWWYGTQFKKPSKENPFGRVLSCRWDRHEGLGGTRPGGSSEKKSVVSKKKKNNASSGNSEVRGASPERPSLNQLTVVNTYVVNAGDELQRLDHKVKEFTPELGSFVADHIRASASVGPTSTSEKEALVKKLVGAGLNKKRSSSPLVGMLKEVPRAATNNSQQNSANQQPTTNTVSKSNSLVVWAGDFNCAPQNWDRYWSRDFEAMESVAGFTKAEKRSLASTLDRLEMVDAFQSLYPNCREAYTFWSYRFNRRQLDEGWRLDGFMVPKKDLWRVVDVFPLKEVMGSDHCPVVMWLWK